MIKWREYRSTSALVNDAAGSSSGGRVAEFSAGTRHSLPHPTTANGPWFFPCGLRVTMVSDLAAAQPAAADGDVTDGWVTPGNGYGFATHTLPSAGIASGSSRFRSCLLNTSPSPR